MSELWILGVVTMAFALILGIAKPKTAISVIGCMILLLLLKPFSSAVANALPWWVNLTLMIFFGFSAIGWLIGFVFSPHARSVLAGLLLHDIILIPFRLIGFIARRR